MNFAEATLTAIRNMFKSKSSLNKIMLWFFGGSILTLLIAIPICIIEISIFPMLFLLAAFFVVSMFSLVVFLMLEIKELL